VMEQVQEKGQVVLCPGCGKQLRPVPT
jgi:hypothetical protein